MTGLESRQPMLFGLELEFSMMRMSAILVISNKNINFMALVYLWLYFINPYNWYICDSDENVEVELVTCF